MKEALSVSPLPLASAKVKVSATSGSELLRAATADPAALFSLKVLADRFRAVGVSFILFTLSVIAYSIAKPPASVVLSLML